MSGHGLGILVFEMYPYPLGLPRGTVRAMTTLLFLAGALFLVFTDKNVPETMTSTILILVSFYYGMSRGVTPPEGTDLLKDEGGQRAFNLPALTIRMLLFLGFVAMAVKVVFIGSSSYDELPFFIREVLLLISGFLVGTLAAKFITLFQDDKGEPNKLIFHGKAFLVLTLALVTNLLYILEIVGVAVDIIGAVTDVFVGFYFGNRKK